MKERKIGFTLIEVLIAMLIFGTAATVLVAAYINILSNFEKSRVASNLEEELAYVRQELQLLSDPEAAMEGAEFDLGNGATGIWYSEIEPTEMPSLFRVRLWVECVDQDGNEASEAAQFYLLRPTWADPEENDRLREDLQERMADFREDQQWGWGFFGS